MKTLSLFAVALVSIAAGCGGRHVDSLGGTWSMDLSPKQDQSYVKEFVVVPDTAAKGRFTGSVYGGTAFDNGLFALTENGTPIFSFVSDLSGVQGGPYYWLGYMTDANQTRGTVRSLQRNFQLDWTATRISNTTMPSEPN